MFCRVVVCLGCCALASAVIGVEPPADGLTREALQKSLELGRNFLLNSQTSAGNFNYLYDWKRQVYSSQDSPVRQAGATWGLASIYAHHKSRPVEQGVQRALDFMNAHSQLSAAGSRHILYPGQATGRTGTVALVTLAHLDYLDAAQSNKDAQRRYRDIAHQYVRFLRQLQLRPGRWYGSYKHRDGEGWGPPSPYFDGEVLLALVKAAKYHEFDDLRPEVIRAAQVGFQTYVAEAIAGKRDSATTKGYYQWGSMAFYELATTDWNGSEPFADYVINMADWMIDVHRTTNRTRNTAYAYEGIIPAYKLAKLRQDTEHVKKFGQAIESQLAKLTSWQIGHPLANEYVREAGTNDLRALGGIQNHRREPFLRIDVTQHQMNAVILALKYFTFAE